MNYVINSSWDGKPLKTADEIHISLESGANDVKVHIEAPFYKDPPPSDPPGKQ